ncbi:MAG TPA: pyridoxamine 5'-phosphate oxidase family protein [Dehalococcoidia bacterium]|nr:pyridoxamine 5'-phosphate oxidase family protein [Dehalococcoidia bacterium]
MATDPGDGYPGELKTPRTTLKRRPERGAHDWDTIAAILDEGLYCHIGFEAEGQPYAIPTNYGREGSTLYIHGSSASRMVRSLSGGIPLCFTVTIIDGLILARATFHNSINYRSVMVLGTAHLIEDEAEKMRGLEIVTEHIIRGRWADSRPPTRQEMKGTGVLRMEVEEASAKVRTGFPKDEPEDMDFPVWAGRIPLSLVAGEPETAPDVAADLHVPPYAREYTRGQK